MSWPPGRFPAFPQREPLPVPDPPTGDPDYITVTFQFQWMPYLVSLLIPMTYHAFWSGPETEVNAAVDYAESLIADFAGEHSLLPGQYFTLGDPDDAVLGWSTRLAGGGG